MTENFAGLLMVEKRVEELTVHLRKIIDASPDFDKAWEYLVGVLKSEGESRRAMETLRSIETMRLSFEPTTDLNAPNRPTDSRPAAGVPVKSFVAAATTPARNHASATSSRRASTT